MHMKIGYPFNSILNQLEVTAISVFYFFIANLTLLMAIMGGVKGAETLPIAKSRKEKR